MRNQNKFKRLILLFLAVMAVCGLSRTRAWAGSTQLLVNPSFEQNNGNTIPTGWTYFLPPEPGNTHTNDYWIEGTGTTPHSGAEYWKQWGAGYFAAPTNNVAGIYQTFGSAPASVYQAGGWFFTKSGDGGGLGGGPSGSSHVWMEVSFLNSSGTMLALYKSADFYASTGMDQWFQFNVTNACDLTSPVSTGDPYYPTYAVTGSVSSMVAPAGTTQVRYKIAYLQAAGEGGSCYFDDTSLVQSTGLIPPVISNIFPIDMIFVAPSNGLSFNVSSPSGSTINNNAIHLTLNGTDVSSSLAITGSVSNKAVLYQGLQSNTIYNASITATDAFNLSVSASNYFETTWIGIPPILYLWEAEDYDFNNGMYVDFPDLCNAPGDNNCYFGQVGVFGVDENVDGESVNHLYRTNDDMNLAVSGDFLRANLFMANRTDYEINPFEQGEWVNYTRDFTNGTYWIIGRLATDINQSGSLTMSVVNADSSLTELGTFSINGGRGWTSFENVFLVDTNGNKANVTLKGKTTLQVKSGGNLLPNFFALVVATVDQPIISGMYPTGTQPFEYTNTLSFNIMSVGATFPAGSINVTLDGFDVSSNLVMTGSSSNKTVVYPTLLQNAMHIAVISVTNSLGHGFLLTNQFDTFSQNNFMVEAEDFDYGGGQYITPWSPDAYDGYGATTNIDFQHSTISGEQYPYRTDGIPEEIARDFLRQTFISSDGTDYHLAWYGVGDWASYTRPYPTGPFYVYMRTAGLGSFLMTLGKVASGAGTSNQVIQILGHWGGVGVNNQTHQWVELTDNGLSAPVVVNLNGLATMRISTSTGDCYPSYFMLVPASGIKVSASKQAGNASISFPTQSGVAYRVFYRSDLSSGSWNLLTNVLGNGSVESVSVAPGAGARYYMVVAP
ncbi:MAG TPA: hypothetical protein VFC44_11350 [Candidatus Saccharimonadales bacterium]|nr:hypothetical protein [Candidatus Saccharimonadales bacterium]